LLDGKVSFVVKSEVMSAANPNLFHSSGAATPGAGDTAENGGAPASVNGVPTSVAGGAHGPVNSPTFSPLYQQIKSLITRSLQSGEWKPGEMIPSEVELAGRFKVSQGTVRKAIDAAGHPALLLVDSISGLASADYRHDEWGVDVTVSGSQKGLMLPPGISFNAVSKKAIAASKNAKLPRAFWDWTEIIAMNASGYWPYTPNTNLLYALSEALDMILGEGLDNVFARHQRLAEACRKAVNAWGLQVQCLDPAVFSPVLTGVMTPDGFDADQIRKVIYENFDMSLGTGIGKMKGRMFRIGHLGEANDLTLMATLAGCEMGLKLAGVALAGSGVLAAMEHLSSKKNPSLLKVA